jgi:hypothetical protein
MLPSFYPKLNTISNAIFSASALDIPAFEPDTLTQFAPSYISVLAASVFQRSCPHSVFANGGRCVFPPAGIIKPYVPSNLT